MTLSIANITEFIKARIAEADPDIDTSDGTAISDLMVKPLSVIFQPLVDEAIRISESQSILNAQSLSEPDLDALVANFFVTRRSGSFSFGSVRIFLSEPIDFVVPRGAPFISSNGIKFTASSTTDVSKAQVRLNKEGTLFFLDVSVTAEVPGESGNVKEGSITQAPTLGPDVIRVTNTSQFTGGSDKETNDELVSRTKKSITVRDLVTDPGITTVLLDEFPQVVSLKAFGFGDPGMERDLLVGSSSFTLGGLDALPPSPDPGVHIGGKVDIIVKTLSIISEDIDFTMDGSVDTFVLRPSDDFDGTSPPTNLGFLDLFKRPFVQVTKIEEVDPVSLSLNGNVMSESITHDSGDSASMAPDTSSGTSKITDLSASFLTTLSSLIVPDTNIVLEVISNPKPKISSVDITEFVIDSIDSDTVLTVQGEIDSSISDIRFRIKTIQDYDIIVDNPSLRFSSKERTRIVLRDGLGNLSSNIASNMVWRITSEHVPDISLIQSFVDKDENRVVAADLLVKYVEPSFVSMSIDFSSSQAIDPLTTSLAVSLITDFVNKLDVAGRLEASDIVDLLYNNGADFVQLPFTMTLKSIDRFGVTKTKTSINTIDLSGSETLIPDSITASIS